MKKLILIARALNFQFNDPATASACCRPVHLYSIVKRLITNEQTNKQT